MEIKNANYDLCGNIEQLRDYVLSHAEPEETLADLLNKLLVEHEANRAEVIRRAHINETFGYQIFMGSRNPSRNKIIALAFGMGAALAETQKLLYAGGVSMLSRTNARDLVVGFGIYSHYSLSTINEVLFAYDFELVA